MAVVMSAYGPMTAMPLMISRPAHSEARVYALNMLTHVGM